MDKSINIAAFFVSYDRVAQLVERRFGKDKDVGSIPAPVSKNKNFKRYHL